LRSVKDIVVADAAADDRTVEIYRPYLRPLGSEAILAVPISHREQIAGTIWLEHESKARSWNTEEITFASAIAGMLAMRVAAQSGCNHYSVLPDSKVEILRTKAGEVTRIEIKPNRKMHAEVYIRRAMQPFVRRDSLTAIFVALSFRHYALLPVSSTMNGAQRMPTLIFFTQTLTIVMVSPSRFTMLGNSST
jgi:hypothetical protein